MPEYVSIDSAKTIFKVRRKLASVMAMPLSLFRLLYHGRHPKTTQKQ
jgi:hypothetical protein